MRAIRSSGCLDDAAVPTEIRSAQSVSSRHSLPDPNVGFGSQNRKSSMQAYVFRFAPESGRRATCSAYPFGAPIADIALLYSHEVRAVHSDNFGCRNGGMRFVSSRFG